MQKKIIKINFTSWNAVWHKLVKSFNQSTNNNCEKNTESERKDNSICFLI